MFKGLVGPVERIGLSHANSMMRNKWKEAHNSLSPVNEKLANCLGAQ